MMFPLIELLTPRQSAPDVEAGLEKFRERCAAILACEAVVSIPDNPLGHLHFTATEVLGFQAEPPEPARLLIHLNTFHRKPDLDALLDQAADLGIRRLLCVSGDGGPRLSKLAPADLGCSGSTVTSVELLGYIGARHGDRFECGVAFNPYEPPEHELEKLRRKIEAGARFVVTQPVMEDRPEVRALSGFGLPVWVGAWMSRRLDIFYQCIGREPAAGAAAFDPLGALRSLRTWYPGFGLYLSMLNFRQDWCAALRELGHPAAQRGGQP